ncbi:hypothetical protein GobsT_22600 [Gemmata obscuriglobus]|uniref:DUF7919 domain-containing protein n=1 Tax=Gemmata obscuriglobus TaxID=114 RepID=A0A2Z3H106_9BACT|nr:hypothetical protein [Gemmata obscuriglobus]AWM39418.1 hypothetical protein C1280_22130 [Gemmata obscuriglobus]QEG27504.1 hypothetical protein GobsT_22600 [Gemmata obscuriglobus]VTS04527.1 Uncharacterized protein OS=Roseiflexus castenholzii (strain DSM 13941 / HLO8) GN=Rcas_0244 PE=4 SV=1 [Gemmata obscuriglobus UQM 2246]
MSWFPDMGTACMIAHGDHVRAVGWLSDQHPFPTGDTPPEFLARLKEFCRRWDEGLGPLVWDVFMGPHRCELCGRCVASGNIGVPAGGVLFAAPEMIAHYVEVHKYAPPAEFVAAVLSAPLPGTREYAVAVAAFRAVALQQQLGELYRPGQPPRA